MLFHIKNILCNPFIYTNGIIKHYTKHFTTFAILYLASCACQAESSIPFQTYDGYIEGNQLVNIDIINHIINKEDKDSTLKHLKDNVIIVILSTTWCPNCPAVLKAFDKLHNELKNQKINKIKIIALNIGNENNKQLKTQYTKHGINNLDFQSTSPEIIGKIIEIIKIRGVPTCFIFDINDNLVCGYSGSNFDFCSEEFINFLKSLTQKK